jgi:hypothetical protein
VSVCPVSWEPARTRASPIAVIGSPTRKPPPGYQYQTTRGERGRDGAPHAVIEREA